MLSVIVTAYDTITAAVVCNMPITSENELYIAKDAMTYLFDRSLAQYDTIHQLYSIHDLLRMVAKDVFSYGIIDVPQEEAKRTLEGASERYTEHYLEMMRLADPEFME